MAHTAPVSDAHNASRQRKVEPPRPRPRSARQGVVKPCNECVASHTRCDRARPTCEHCDKRAQPCSWPDQEVEDPAGVNTFDDPFLPTTTTTLTTMNPPPVGDNPTQRLLNALNASNASELSEPIAPFQSFTSSRLATTTTTSSELVSSPVPEEDDSPIAQRGAPETVSNSSQPQTQRAPDAPILEISTAEEEDDDDDLPAENDDRNRNETSLGYEQPRRVPGVIYMGSRRTGREVPLLRFLPR